MDQNGERKQRKRLATTSRWIIAGLAGSAAALVALHAGRLIAAAPVVFLPPARPMGSLKTVPVPGPTEQELAVFVRDRKAAIQLGKALFWDMRVGSDNLTACASCHFQAGADNRITNQINPGLLAGDNQFNTGSAKQAGPNYKLRAADFPLVRHGDVDDAGTIIADNNDVVGSQGVFAATYDDIKPNGRKDDCTNISDSLMHGGTGFDVSGVNVRRVTGRNAPSVINAVFNFRNFWDGRANNVFNGGDPFGMRNPQPLVWKLEGSVLRNVPVRLSSSSLASQASGPPMSNVEMSCAGRAFIDLGKRLLDETILRAQTISPKDSVLGGFAANAPTYSQLVRKAFQPAFWDPGQYDRDPARHGADVERAVHAGARHLPGGRHQRSGAGRRAGPAGRLRGAPDRQSGRRNVHCRAGQHRPAFAQCGQRPDQLHRLRNRRAARGRQARARWQRCAAQRARCRAARHAHPPQ
ncbi:hypothetical protein A9975_25135 [Cupriavidus sp. UME77]|nr:hypothetical protein [Cupriavidus sp. UME77]